MDDTRTNGEAAEAEGAERGPAARVIERFGGIRPMASKLNVPVTTVQYWKKRGLIPAARRQDIVDAAARNDVALDTEELDAAMREDAAAAEPAAAAAGPATPAASDEPPRRPAQDTAPAPAPARNRDSAARALAVLGLLAGLGGAGLAGYMWQQRTAPQGPDPALASRVEALASSVAALDQRVSQLPQDVPDVGSAVAGAVQPLQQRLDALEERIGEMGALRAQLQELAQATGGLDELAQRLAALENRPAATGASPAELDELRGRVAQLTQALGQVRQEIGGLASDEQMLRQLEGRIADLAATQSALRDEIAGIQNTDSRAGAFALAVGQLSTALARPDSFSTELAAVQALANDDPVVQEAIRAVEPFAFTGIPTIPQLAAQFDLLATDILRAELPEQEGWRETLSRAFGDVVTVRRTGPVEGDRTDAIIARAQARLERDDLEGALEVLDGLTGPAREVAQPWLEDAAARLLANRAASELASQAAQRLSAAPSAQDGSQ